MTAIMARELNAPYQYVVAEEAVRDAARLLETEPSTVLVVSLWYQQVQPQGRCTLSELRGLGKEVWGDIDPRDYVDRLRDEWRAG